MCVLRLFRRLGPTPAVATLAAAVMLIAVASGCSITPDSRMSDLRPADTVVARGTADPRAAPAIAAYEAFMAAAVTAQRHPVGAGYRVPAAADLSRLAFDPVRAEYELFVKHLAATHLRFRGDAPTSQLTVTRIDLDAQPWPTIALADCRMTPASWLPHDTRNDEATAMQWPGLQEAGPVAVTMVFYQQHWGVQTILPTKSPSCPAG